MSMSMKRSGLAKRYLNTTTYLMVTGFIGWINVSSVYAAGNPFITSIYTADPSAHVWNDGRLYVYASHDVYPPSDYNLMDGYHVFSTDDLINWTDEGQVLSAKQVTWGRPAGGFMWAPDCAYKNGVYYFYFPHPSEDDWNPSWKIGVATSQKPASDFTSQGYIKGLDGPEVMDPCVFVDAGGQGYIFYGGAGSCYGGKLKNNMVELDGAILPMLGLTDFFGATWVFKREGMYFLTYSDNHPDGGRLHYATSPNPLGPWTYRGIYLASTGCKTSQGSVVEFKGRWYAFYHNQILSGQENLRSICVDRLFFDTKLGTIQEVAQTTAGVPSVGSGPTKKYNSIKYEAEQGELSHGATAVDKPDASAGRCVRDLQEANASIQFNNVDGGEGGRSTVSICFSTILGKRTLGLVVNDADYVALNTHSTGEWFNFSGHTSLTVPLLPGPVNTIKIIGGNGGVNVDYITVTSLSGKKTASKPVVLSE